MDHKPETRAETLYESEYRLKLTALVHSGAVTNRYKNINRHKNVYTLAAGEEAFYEFINDNSSMEAHPVDYVNDPTLSARNDNVISISALLEVGPRRRGQFRGNQGQTMQRARRTARFRARCSIVTGRQIDPCGIFDRSKGTVSRIVPKIEGPTTGPRADTQYIVTEYGVADMTGNSTTERAAALIAIAHPKFRGELG